MRTIKQLIDFYIHSSLHVAFSCFSMVKITAVMFHIPNVGAVSLFTFFGTVLGYNFIKYSTLIRIKKGMISNNLKAILLLSIFSFCACFYFFLKLENTTQYIAIVFLGLTVLYTLPFFPNIKNARNWAGIKIYMVALCWVGVTLVLPVLNADVLITDFFYWKCLQRFLLIFILILVFEIVDLQNDDPHLHTVPQQIGVKRTKILGYALLVVFTIIEVWNSGLWLQNISIVFYLEFFIAGIIALFLVFALPKRSKYYSTFWAESIPIVWYSLIWIACLFS